MLRWIALLAIAAVSETTSLASQPNETINGGKSRVTQSQPVVRPQDVPNKQSGGSEDNSKTSSYSQPPTTALISWYKKAEWWSLIVTSMAAGIVGWQSWETRKAAEAALQNSKAFISSERPWIKVDFSEKDIGRGFGISVRAHNRGNTPASLISKSKHHRITELGELLPSNPIYDPDIFKYPTILFPGESIELFWLFRREDAIGFKEKSPEFEKWKNVDGDANIFGNVIYKDTLGGEDIHQTRWCFYVFPSDSAGGFTLIEQNYKEEYSYHT